MKKLHVLINPAVNFCRLFGLGLLYRNTYIDHICDSILVLMNILLFVYCYFHITAFISKEMHELWDITTVVGVIRVYIRILAPGFMLLLWQFKKQTLTKIHLKLDYLVPSINIEFLRSYVWYSIKWLFMKTLKEYIMFTTFIIRMGFRIDFIEDYFLMAITCCWLYIPIFQYIFIIKTIHLGLQTINSQINSMSDWKEFRQTWKDLRFLAINLTNSVLGETIIIHIICKAAEIVFILFTCYFYGYKTNDNLMTYLIIVNVFIEAFWVFELYRQCQNCKFEMLKTQTVLNSINIKTKSDYKEVPMLLISGAEPIHELQRSLHIIKRLQYASLYMLHTDFNFKPCEVLELNYRSLLKMATLITAFVVFQIQMKLH